MSLKRPPFPGRRGAAAAIGLAFIGLAAACATPGAIGGTQAHSAQSSPLRCEVAVSGPSSARSFEGRVQSDRPVTGTYRLVIRRSGSSGQALITQAGDFNVSPGRPARLGQATLGGDHARYSVELELRWNGQRTQCRETTGTIIL